MDTNVYIGSMAHFSNAYEDIHALFAEKGIYNKLLTINDSAGIRDPDDLYETIEQRGSLYKDSISKIMCYLTMKLKAGLPADDMMHTSIYWASEQGNIQNMLKLSMAACESTKPISAQLFPNSTISSAMSQAAILIKAGGMCVMVNHGLLSMIQALILAFENLKEGKIKHAFIMAGDDFTSFIEQDIAGIGIVQKFYSSLNSLILTTDKRFCHPYGIYVLEDVFLDSIYSFNCLIDRNRFGNINLWGGYTNSKDLIEQTNGGNVHLLNLPVYTGAAVTFLGLVNALYYLQQNPSSAQYQGCMIGTDHRVGGFTVKRM